MRADRAAREAEKRADRARLAAEMDELDAKVRRKLRARDAELEGLREDLAAAVRERDAVAQVVSDIQLDVGGYSP